VHDAIQSDFPLEIVHLPVKASRPSMGVLSSIGVSARMRSVEHDDAAVHAPTPSLYSPNVPMYLTLRTLLLFVGDISDIDP
jgi:hypothetical protein